MEETREGLRVNIDGDWRVVGLRQISDSPRYLLTLDDRVIEVLVGAGPQAFDVQIGGRSYQVETGRGRRAREDTGDQFLDGRWLLRAPLTGVLVEIRVTIGDYVEAGTVVLVVEAMKMLNELRARVAGTVSALNFAERDRVEIGNVLLEVNETPAPHA